MALFKKIKISFPSSYENFDQGQIFIDINSKKVKVWDGTKFINFGIQEERKQIRFSTCKHCGAPLPIPEPGNNFIQCQYCGSYYKL